MNAIEKAKEALDIALGRNGVFNPPELDLMCEAYEALQSLEGEAVGKLVDAGFKQIEWYNKPPLESLLYTTPQPPAVPDGMVMVPIEPGKEILSAMATSQASDADGEFPMLMDILDYSGENKTRAVIKAAYKAAITAAQQEDKS